MKKFAAKAVIAAAVKAGFDYLRSPSAKKWEIALLAGLGDAIYQAVKAAF